MSNRAVISIQQLIDALMDADTALASRYLFRLSDLERSDLNKLEAIWNQIPVWRRQALMEDIGDLAETDTLLSFEALGRLALRDEDARVRLLAINALFECEEKDLASLFLGLMENDPDEEVRAAAAGALGRFVYLGEIEAIPAKMLHEIENRLLHVVNSPAAPKIRRMALEALGYSGRREVSDLIRNAYASEEKEWIASSLFAMGRSADKAWEPKVIESLENKLPLIRCEAARAAGELELRRARRRLIELLEDPDENTRLASIWSLSQIGGEGIRSVLEKLFRDTEDDAEADLISAALDNLDFNSGMQLMPMFDFPDSYDADEDAMTDFDDMEDIEEIEGILEDENDEDSLY